MEIVIAHFSTHWVGSSGGVEKTVCALSGAMTKRGHHVTVLYLGEEEGDPYFPLDPGVETRNILFENGQKIIGDKLPMLLRVYREIARTFSKTKAREINAVYKGKQYGKQIQRWFANHKADIVLSVSPMSAKYLLIDGQCRVPTIEMTREDPESGFAVLSKEEKEAVAKAKAMQVLLPEDLKTAGRYFPNVPAYAIGNIASVNALQAAPGAEKKRYKITNVGTVCSRKNQKLLVEAFAPLAKQYPDWDLEIYGSKESPYAKKLQKYIDLHHLNQRIYLKGVTRKVSEVYAGSDILAYPSRSEGFPNGVIEAMSAGLPVVGLWSCHGTNQLVKDGVSGFLVKDDVEEFREKLARLMEDAQLRESMGKEGLRETEKYKPEKIWDQWEALLKKYADREAQKI